jgi:hypothetical protein
MGRYRCPVCLVIFYAPESMCAGGWPIYEPGRPGEHRPYHEPRQVVIEGEPERQPLSPTHCPVVLRVLTSEWPLLFGPFPSMVDAQEFALRHGITAYTAGTLFPPSDASHLRIGDRG